MQVNIEIMRTFVRLRELLGTHAQLGARLDELEKKYGTVYPSVAKEPRLQSCESRCVQPFQTVIAAFRHVTRENSIHPNGLFENRTCGEVYG